MRWFSHRRSHTCEDLSRQNRTQAAVNVHCHHPWRPHNGIICGCVQRIQPTAHASPYTMHCQWGRLSIFSFFVPGDVDLWSWHSKSGENFVQCIEPPSFVILTNKQTNKRRWKHPPRFATQRRWVTNDDEVQNSCTRIRVMSKSNCFMIQNLTKIHSLLFGMILLTETKHVVLGGSDH